jgi:hypothetical protein
LYLDAELLQFEAGGKLASQLNGSEQVLVQIEDGAATRANQMVVGMKIGIDAPSAVMQAHFAQHAGLNKGLEVFIDGRKRDRRQDLY